MNERVGAFQKATCKILNSGCRKLHLERGTILLIW